MLLSLAVVTFLSSLLLGSAYSLTKERIEEAMAQKINGAIAQVSPPFDNLPSEELFIEEFEGKNYKIFPAKMGGELVGYAIESSSTGFGGVLTLMVGFNLDGVIVGVTTLSHSETPGLGDKIEAGKSNFKVQFEGKSPKEFKLSVKRDGGDVDAITASTITSKAFCGAIDRAWGVYTLCQEKNNPQENLDEEVEISN